MKAITASSMRRFGSVAPSGHGVTIPAYHPASKGARSIFPSRVYDPDEVARVLKTGHQSRKIGKTVAKGHRKGWPIFTLTLEERATCPRTCLMWQSCYGNNCHAAERIVAGPDLERALIAELGALQRKHPRGFLVRLHVLGDFYSTAYVEVWREALVCFPALHVFGFTARPRDSEIGDSVARLTDEFGWERFAIRYSGAGEAERSADILGSGAHERAIPCPAQTGAVDCCATCSICWASERSIGFARH